MNLIVYTKGGCPWTAGVVKLLKEKNVPFEERDVVENENYFKELVEKSNQTLTPTLDINGVILPDSDARQVKEYLGEKNVPGF